MDGMRRTTYFPIIGLASVWTLDLDWHRTTDGRIETDVVDGIAADVVQVSADVHFWRVWRDGNPEGGFFAASVADAQINAAAAVGQAIEVDRHQAAGCKVIDCPRYCGI